MLEIGTITYEYKEMNQTLAEFAKSIQFAADSLKDLDTSGAKSMH